MEVIQLEPEMTGGSQITNQTWSKNTGGRRKIIKVVKPVIEESDEDEEVEETIITKKVVKKKKKKEKSASAYVSLFLKLSRTIFNFFIL